MQTAQPVRMQPVYRSLSRYHKKGRQEAAAAGSQNTKGAPPMPALAQRQEPRGGGHDSVREKKLNGEMQGHRPSGPPVADGLQLPIRTTSARDVPMPQDSTPAVSQGSQAQASVSTSTLHPSRSRYRRRQAPTTQDPLPQSRTPLFAHELAPMAALHAPENHQDALRKLQRQASLPTPSQTPPAHGLITKASLNRLPDDTEPDAAVHRRVSQFRAQGAERRHREEKQVEDTQKQVKKLLDAEAERHRRMHARIQAQREREEAARQADESDKEKRLRQIEEEQQEKERVLAERERQLEERERQAKQKENGKDGEASVSRGRRTREEQSKVDERTDTGSPHKRKESKEDRTQRHRKRSLSALEGKPIHRQKSDEAPPPVPTPPEPADSRVPLVSFLKKRKPTESPKPAGVDRSKSIKKPEQATKAKAAATAPGIDAPISAVNAGERVR